MRKLETKELFILNFKNEVNAAISQEKNLYLAFLDLNSLKMINDTYGHSVGDYVIQQVQQIIESNRNEGTFARFGGDEFMFSFLDYTPLDIEHRMAGIQLGLRTEIYFTDNDYGISGSVGIVKFDPEQHKCFEDCFSEADRLMYLAKKKPPSFRITSWNEPVKEKRELNTHGSRLRAYFEWITTTLAKENPLLPFTKILHATRTVFESKEYIQDYSPKLLLSLVMQELKKGNQ